MQTSTPTPRTRAIINSLLSIRQLQLTYGPKPSRVDAAAMGKERRERANRPCPCGSSSPFVLCHGPLSVPQVSTLKVPAWARGAAWENGPEWRPVATDGTAAADLLLPDGLTAHVELDAGVFRVSFTAPPPDAAEELHYQGRSERQAQRATEAIVRCWRQQLAPDLARLNDALYAHDAGALAVPLDDVP